MFATIVTLVVLGALALVGGIASLVVASHDGYGAVPARDEFDRIKPA